MERAKNFEPGRIYGFEHWLPPIASQSRRLSFETAQFLMLGDLMASPSTSRTLLKVLHGYDVGPEQELSQAVRRLGVGRGRDVLQVATLWCLSLGPGLFYA